jgi:uncharacterized membrane protein
MGWRDYRRWLLPASLTLNAFVAGALVAQFAHAPGPPPPGPAELARIMSRDMDGADRDAVHEAFDTEQEQFAASERMLRAARGRIRAVLEAPALDSAALKQALDGVREAHAANDAAIAAVLIEAAAALSPEGRHRLARQNPAADPPGGGRPPPER